MRFFPLVWAGVWRKRARTILTYFSVVTAFLLYGVLDGTVTGFNYAIDQATDDSRLVTLSRINLNAALPRSYLQQIERVPGVKSAAYFYFFGGRLADGVTSVGGRAVDVDRLESMEPDFIVAPEQIEAMRRMRNGAIVGREYSERYGWKIGDRFSMQSPWTRTDGSNIWVFEVVGIYDISPSLSLTSTEVLINYDYFDEARASGRGTVSGYSVRVSDIKEGGRIAHDIDNLFANSSDETTTQTEADLIRAQVDQIGDIRLVVNAIVSAVFFTLIFVTGNTMMQSIRERIPELAVLKTYGYSTTVVTSLVVTEALFLCVTAAAIGLAVAASLFPVVYSAMGIAPQGIDFRVLAFGLSIAVALALVSAMPPAWRVHRLNIVDALARR